MHQYTVAQPHPQPGHRPSWRLQVELPSDTAQALAERLQSFKDIRSPAEFDSLAKKSIKLLRGADDLAEALGRCMPGPLRKRYTKLMKAAQHSAAPAVPPPERSPTPDEESPESSPLPSPASPGEGNGTAEPATDEPDRDRACADGEEPKEDPEPAAEPDAVEPPPPPAEEPKSAPAKDAGDPGELRFLAAVRAVLAARPKQCMAIALLCNKLQQERRKEYKRYVQPSPEAYLAKHFAMVRHGSSLFVGIDDGAPAAEAAGAPNGRPSKVPKLEPPPPSPAPPVAKDGG